VSSLLSFFIFNATPPTDIYTLSLHDALPISRRWRARAPPYRTRTPPKRDRRLPASPGTHRPRAVGLGSVHPTRARVPVPPLRSRSEEHTSELQSRGHLVCRLLLEKKKKKENK